MTTLPKEVQYNKPMASLPSDTKSTNVIVRPSNNTVFGAGGDIIQFDLPAHAFLVPSSLTLRGRIKSVAAVDATANYMWGAPAASWIQRVETIVGGTLIESINDYGRLYNMISQTKIDYATKAGLQLELAYGGGGSTGNDPVNPTFHTLNGRQLPTGTTSAATQEFGFALPLGCLLSSCSELIPLGLMGGVRIQITTDMLQNFVQCHTPASPPTFDIKDLELNFDLVDFGAGMEGVVASMANANGDLLLKSQGWNVSNVNFPQQVAGNSTDFIYNVRLSSIKSLVLQGSGTASANAVGGLYEAVKYAGESGSTQFFVANTPLPPTPIRESNQASVMSSLRQAFGEGTDIYSSNIAIPTKQYIRALGGAATTFNEPDSHFVGVNCEKLSTNSVMMSGLSSQLTPISVRVEAGDATNADATLTLFACYDAILSIQPATRQVATRV